MSRPYALILLEEDVKNKIETIIEQLGTLKAGLKNFSHDGLETINKNLDTVSDNVVWVIMPKAGR